MNLASTYLLSPKTYLERLGLVVPLHHLMHQTRPLSSTGRVHNSWVSDSPPIHFYLAPSFHCATTGASFRVSPQNELD